MALFPGLGVAGYRSLSGEPQWVDTDHRITVLLGQNNAGKSNVLRLYMHLIDLYRAVNGVDRVSKINTRLDVPRSAHGPKVEIYWPLDIGRIREEDMSRVESILYCKALNRFPTPCLPFFAESLTDPLELSYRVALEMMDEPNGIDWRQTSSDLTGSSGGRRGEDVLRVLGHLKQAMVEPPSVHYVPPTRNISTGDEEAEWDFSGSGVVRKISRLLNPKFDEYHLRSQATALRDGLRDLLEDDTLEYEVPHDLETINIRVGGDFYPLESLGTGTEHAILILAAAIVYEGGLLCLEEPDAHMHPTLQRRLIRILNESPVAQIVLATHSAHMIDLLQGATISVRKQAGRTSLRSIANPDVFFELQALGYRASDLLQADSLLWVEGPSDRIYLLHWLQIVAPELREGIDFGILFYGGSLLARLTAEADSALNTTLVEIWRVNQNSWIVMDADRAAAGGDLKPAVDRLQSEIAAAGRGGTWTTAGYTVENYVDPSVLLAAVQDVHKTVETMPNSDASKDPLVGLEVRGGGTLKKPDKVAIALSVVRRSDDIEVLDLRERLLEVAQFIRASAQPSPYTVAKSEDMGAG